MAPGGSSRPRSGVGLNRRHLLAAALGGPVVTGLPMTAAFAATAASAEPAAPTALSVLASFSILADMTREVAGPQAIVSTLAGANADAHLLQPSPADVQRLARADLVIVNGLRFEGWLDRLVASAGYRGPIVRASDGIVVRRQGPVDDPHAWQSLARGRIYVRNIAAALRETLARRAGAGATPAIAQVELRERDYLARIDVLDAEIRRWFEAVPPHRRHAITSHAAFAYFGEDHGLRFTSLGGWSTESDASAATVARLVRLVRAQRATALFAENIADRRLLQRVADETGVAIGGTLYSDALSPPGGPAETYLRLIEHNARTIVQALREAPLAARP